MSFSSSNKMAHNIEPMDIDINSDFDNKENSIHHSNVYPRTPCTEKGYEELDVSELNMKLRYSVTPTSSPMSKSYTANSIDNKSFDLNGDVLNANLTRSFNSTLSKSDAVTKSSKLLPLQPISADQFIDNIRSTSFVKTLESTQTIEAGDITVTVTNDNYCNLETPSLSSSTVDTPEVTTPTKELPRSDGGSPIMRGLKSVLNMFRSSQSPIPPAESGDDISKQVLSPSDVISLDSVAQPTQSVLASTPITKENASKRNSPLKESIIFNDDLEKELLWKDETTILFSQEKIPIHKLFYQQPLNTVMDPSKPNTEEKSIIENNLNDSVEYMDISCNDFITKDHLSKVHSEEQLVGESDGEFVDCETTFTNDKSGMVDTNEIINNAMLESNPISQSDLNSTVQSLHQNEFSAISNKENSLSASSNKTESNNMSYSKNEEVSNSIAMEKSNIEKHESAVNDEESKLMNQGLISTINASLQKEHNFNVTEKQAVVISEFENKDIKLLAINEQFHNTMCNSPQFNVTSLQGDSFQNSDSDKFGLQDSLNEIIDKNSPEFNQISIEVLNEKNVSPSDEHTKMVGIEKDSIVPANIPLPDEDCFEFETQSNKDVLPNTKLNINPSDIHKVVFDGQLESLACADTMPIKSLTSHESQGENKTINVNIDGNLVTNTYIQESNVKDATISISIHENNDFGATDIGDVTQQLIKNIDDIVRNAECIVQHQQTEMTVMSNNVELQLADDFQSENVPLPCESSSDNQNDAVIYALQTELTGLGMEVLNKSVCLEACNKKNSDVNKEDQSLNIDKQLCEQSSHDVEKMVYPENEQNNIVPIINNNLLSLSNKNEPDDSCSKPKHSVEETIITHHDNMENIFEATRDINKEAKSELLPDVISDTMCMPDIRLVDGDKDTVTPNDIESAQANFTEIKAYEEILRNKDEIEVNIEEVILSEDNSPFVSIASPVNCTEKQPLSFKDETAVTITTEFPSSPPISPKISSKGYNFNFDEIDDPFATKTKIRLSPPPDSPKENVLKKVEKTVIKRDMNTKRRKSLQERNNLNQKDINNKKLPDNMPKLDNEIVKSLDSISQAIYLKTQSKALNKQITDNPEKGNLIQDIEPDLHSNQVADKIVATKSVENNALNEKHASDNSSEVVINEENTLSVESVNSSNDVRNTSSSEQSTYYSANMSNEAARNVFNIPEIDDVNFNPFLAKPKMRESPETCNNDSFNSKCNDSFNDYYQGNKSPEALDDKDCANISNTTCSSKSTEEKDITVREVHTEDEDTIEGPFLETEGLNNVDKMSDFEADDVDMMQFSELPSQGTEEQLEGGEMFIDAEAFEFLLNQNKSNDVSDSGKESLFLKFDPLFAKRVSTGGVIAALSKIQKKQSTPKNVSVAQQLDITFEKSDLGPSTSGAPQKPNLLESAEDYTDDPNAAVSKPMMVVTPAVNPIVAHRNKLAATPTSSNRRSITFTSPAIAVIDRLLSLSGNNSLLGHDSTITQANREQDEADHALRQLRELLAEKEINVYNLRSESKELKNRLSSLESQMRTLETESEERLRKINDLNEKLSEKTKLNKSMALVVEEYERTIASLIAESEQDKRHHNEERLKLIKERDEHTKHLASMEVSFNDLHSKYEKSKQIIMTCKANEDTYKKSIKDFEESLSKMQSNYELLKQHATTKLNHANQELEKMNRTHEAEVLKLNAMIKRKELHITSLEETLAQKTKANEELTAICDELINKVG
ncbi:unnamed protein product [Diatraea saccharalis]|uniref:Transforming acidic coiled-coil-containing protein C-terminal domain-containing protein n=1 Tax=Diatraea saccharalis TaxID=40085 RepID=A0A9P0C8R2_9NEOP|nr:unnamed protein product [Diatraea saccharalis]